MLASVTDYHQSLISPFHIKPHLYKPCTMQSRTLSSCGPVERLDLEALLRCVFDSVNHKYTQLQATNKAGHPVVVYVCIITYHVCRTTCSIYMHIAHGYVHLHVYENVLCKMLSMDSYMQIVNMYNYMYICIF